MWAQPSELFTDRQIRSSSDSERNFCCVGVAATCCSAGECGRAATNHRSLTSDEYVSQQSTRRYCSLAVHTQFCSQTLVMAKMNSPKLVSPGTFFLYCSAKYGLPLKIWKNSQICKPLEQLFHLQVWTCGASRDYISGRPVSLAAYRAVASFLATHSVRFHIHCANFATNIYFFSF